MRKREERERKKHGLGKRTGKEGKEGAMALFVFKEKTKEESGDDSLSSSTTKKGRQVLNQEEIGNPMSTEARGVSWGKSKRNLAHDFKSLRRVPQTGEKKQVG